MKKRLLKRLLISLGVILVMILAPNIWKVLPYPIDTDNQPIHNVAALWFLSLVIVIMGAVVIAIVYHIIKAWYRWVTEKDPKEELRKIYEKEDNWPHM